MAKEKEIKDEPTRTGMWGNNTGVSQGLIPGRKFWGPLMLVGIPPIFVHIMWHTNYNCDGSFARMFSEMLENPAEQLPRAFLTPLDPMAWQIIAVYVVVQAALMRLVPGKEYIGPTTNCGNVPVYKANGVQAYICSILLFLAGQQAGLYNGGVIYNHFGHLLPSMNLLALAFCGFLYIKGRVFPSSTDSGHTGNPIFDYYWGTELYPRIFGWDVKQFTNCRFGMVFWPLSTISYAFAQHERYGYVADSMWVNMVLQLIYCTKFFMWETGYLASMDIQHDRAGYYLCWGCMCFLPTLYTSHTFYLTEHPVILGTPLALAIFAAGALCIYINYDCDRQRAAFRANPKIKIWGAEAQYINAKYRTEKGIRDSTLLYSGWWGMARHFHYVFEISASFFWSLPALFTHFMPYFYVVYLIILLTDRAHRDDARCGAKYGKYWVEYKKKVPYKIIPGLY